MNKKYLCLLFMILAHDAHSSSMLESALTSIFDYDSRAYLAMAREKEAKRRARFEAVKQRLMDEDRELALAGSRLSLSILRVMGNFLLMLLQDTACGRIFKNNSPAGNVGLFFLLSWLGYHGYYWGKKRYFEKTDSNVPTRYLIDNCQSRPKIYTKVYTK